MEELLPPHHIEMSDIPEVPASDDLLPEAAPSAHLEAPTAEPLINNTDDRRPPSVVPRLPPAVPPILPITRCLLSASTNFAIS